tara:strand:+ start:111 stop:827 length:717 start_codon:yes stop_codon:yes gene_type:complete
MITENVHGIEESEETVIEFSAGKYIIRTQEEAVRQIANQQIVGMFQGQSEIGPRALGNRSLLFDPTNPNAKQIVNEIKEREEFRPFAGSMLLEYFDEYFHTSTLKESPYMSYAIPVKKERVQQISSIVHHDYTCRIQTVTEEQNKNYYNLIKAWHEESGCPIVFNTSFNLGGEAMVETLEDAMNTCKNSMVNFIYVPEDQDIDVKEITKEDLEELEREDNSSTAVKELSADKGAFINS